MFGGIMNKAVEDMTDAEFQRFSEEQVKKINSFILSVCRATEESRVENGIIKVECISCGGDVRVAVSNKRARQMGCECGLGMFLD